MILELFEILEAMKNSHLFSLLTEIEKTKFLQKLNFYFRRKMYPILQLKLYQVFQSYNAFRVRKLN